jgi:hypothetical protein
VSTFTDGFPPSVAPEPDDGPGPDLHPARNGSHAGSHASDDDAPDSGPLWLREEIQRRIAEKNSATGGRHARRDGFGAGTPATYVPRHSTTTPGPAVEPPPEPPRRRERRDEILAASATTEAPTPAAWSQPRGPELPDVIGGPSRPLRVPRIRTRDLRRPAPPSGPAAARLLSPPPSPPVPPQTTTPADGVTGPMPMFPAPVREEVLWSATAPPREVPNPAPVVPEQRITERAVEKTDRILPHPIRVEEPDAEQAGPRRVRVVLAERKNVAKPVRTVVDIQEGSAVGELLRQKLIGSQLGVALRFAAGTALTLGVLPLLFALFPQIGRIEVFGIRLPWLLLGFLVYPFLVGIGWWHTRTAERVEQSFADHVQD